MKKFFCLAVLVSLVVPAASLADHGHSRRGSRSQVRQINRGPAYRSFGSRQASRYYRPVVRRYQFGGGYQRSYSWHRSPRQYYGYGNWSGGGRYLNFGFGYSRPPVYVAPIYNYPAPVIYLVPAPVYVQPAPIVVERPMVQMPPPPAPTTQPAENWERVIYKGRVYQYREVGRRLHQHGSDKGLLDWIQGETPDGHLIKIEFADNGFVRGVDD